MNIFYQTRKLAGVRPCYRSSRSFWPLYWCWFFWLQAILPWVH